VSFDIDGGDFKARVLKGFASVGGASVLTAALQIGVTAVLARHVTPAAWGGAAFAISALGFALAMGQFGLAQAVVHTPQLSAAHMSAASLSAWLWSGGCAAILILTSHFIATATGVQDLHLYLYALAPCIVIRAVTGTAEGRLLRIGHFSSLSIIELASYAVGRVGVGIGLALWGGGAWSLICAYIATTIVRFIGIIYIVGLQDWVTPAASTYRDLLPFARGQTLAQTANYVATESDNIIVGAALGPAALGTYGRAYSIAVAPANSLSAAIDKVFYPSLVALSRAGNSIGPTYLLATEIAMTIALPLAMTATVAAPEIVLTLLGPAWVGTISVLQILSVGLVFRALFQASDCFCRAVGAVYGSGVRQSVYAVLVITGATAGSAWGVSGVAAGVVLAMAGKYVLMTQLSLAVLGISAAEYRTAIARGVKFGLLFTTAVFLTVQFCRHAQLPALLTCLVAAVVFAATTALRLWVTQDERLALT
jgi:PST family polysaccharide transporter